jgi:hypothetical protein
MLGAASCAAPSDMSSMAVTIQTDRDRYIPTMSSTVGILLTPAYTRVDAPDTVRYHWCTNYGYFIVWSPPDFRANVLRTEAFSDEKGVYWSYDPGQMGIRKPSVIVSLQIEDSQNNKVLAETSLQIGWEGLCTAMPANAE